MKKKLVVIIIILIILSLIGILVFMKINSKDIELIEEGTYGMKFDEKFSNENEKMVIIEKLIRKKFDKKFELDDYDIYEYKDPGNTMYGAVELKYRINDKRTNLGYIVYAKRNKITETITNMKDIDLEKYKKEIEQAKEHINFETTSDIETSAKLIDKIWVGTFQLAWNELASRMGINIELEGVKSVLVDVNNF